MRRPTILFMNRVYPPVRGATGRVLRDLAKSFAREGWHVTIITTGPKASKERDGGIRIIRVKALELLGKVSDVGLFSEKQEITITHQTSDDLRARLRRKLEKMIDVTPTEDADFYEVNQEGSEE